VCMHARMCVRVFADAAAATCDVADAAASAAVAANAAPAAIAVVNVDVASVAAGAAAVDSLIDCVCMRERVEAPWDQLTSKARQF